MLANKQLAFELQRVFAQFKRTVMLKHDHSKLRGAQRHVIFLIDELKNGQPVTISEIANKIGVTLAAVTHQINSLEKNGLISRLSNSDDRRLVMIKLTEQGKFQVIKLKKEFTEKTQILTEFLGETDTKDLIRLLKRMSEFQKFIK